MSEEVEYKKLRTLLEIREFAARLINDHKELGIDNPQKVRDGLHQLLKKQGYTKINSRNAMAFLKEKVFMNKGDGTYTACMVDTSSKKNPVLYSAHLKRLKVEDNIYYAGSMRQGKIVMIIPPHFFWRYKERTKCKDFEEAITNFLGYLLTSLYDDIKVPESSSGEVYIKLAEGVGLAHKTSLGIQGKDVIFYKTFVSNEMLTEEQKQLLEGNTDEPENTGTSDDRDSGEQSTTAV